MAPSYVRDLEKEPVVALLRIPSPHRLRQKKPSFSDSIMLPNKLVSFCCEWVASIEKNTFGYSCWSQPRRLCPGREMGAGEFVTTVGHFRHTVLILFRLDWIGLSNLLCMSVSSLTKVHFVLFRACC